jgi:hypothetical protein
MIPTRLNVKPTISFLSTILGLIPNGELQIPHFQRPFVWKPESMISLFHSIYNGYPIGSILFWKADKTQECSTLDVVGPHKINNSKEFIKYYVLDGHQRISTLFGVLTGTTADDDENAWQWRIYFDMTVNDKEAGTDTQRFIHIKFGTNPKPEYFPLNKLLKTTDFIAEARRINKDFGAEQGEIYIERAERLLNIIRDYQIPITQIEGGDIDQIVDIFARINSEGEKISIDRMYSALTYKEGEFNLSDKIDEIQENLALYNFQDLDRALIFRSILAATGKDIYLTIRGKNNVDVFRKNIQELKMDEKVKECEKSCLATAAFLRKIGVPHPRFLPYDLQFIALSEFFRLCPNPSEEKSKKMEQWFWVTSFTGIHTMNTSQKNTALKEVQELSKEQDANVPNFWFKEIDFSAPALPLPEQFDLNSSRVKAYILFLFSLKPISPFSGKEVDLTVPNNNTFATIFSDKDFIKHTANRFLVEKANARSIIKELAKENISLFLLKSHSVELYLLKYLKSNYSQEFIDRRMEHLKNEEAKFMESKKVIRPTTYLQGDEALPF